jgi:hypothetical protein
MLSLDRLRSDTRICDSFHGFMDPSQTVLSTSFGGVANLNPGRACISRLYPELLKLAEIRPPGGVPSGCFAGILGFKAHCL